MTVTAPVQFPSPAIEEVPAVIECRDVSKKFWAFDRGDLWRVVFGEVPAGSAFSSLAGVTLDVPRGEFLGVLGRNGAGKSTFLRTVGGVFQPTEGVVRLGAQASGIYEFGVGGRELMTGRHFTMRWLELSDVAADDIPKAVEEVRVFTELHDYFERPLRTYSTGMKARLFFAAATQSTAQIYLIDEVLSVGDDYFNAKCLGRLRERLSGGASGIFATHDWASILRVCSSVVILDKGRIVDCGPPQQLVERYLDLEGPPRTLAAFSDDFPQRLEAVSGGSVEWRIPIEVRDNVDVFLGFSVEQARKGYGWEHFIHRDPEKVTGHAGQYDVSISIPRVPLTAGEYQLCLFLLAEVNGVRQVMDVRSWTHGNPLVVAVAASESSVPFNMSFSWSPVEAA